MKPTCAGDYSQTRVKVQAAIVGGAPPDVVVLGATDLYTMKVLDAIIPLDDFIAREGKDYVEDFFPAFLLNSRLEGKIWSIPFQRSTPILYYNRDLFINTTAQAVMTGRATPEAALEAAQKQADEALARFK